VGVTRAKTFYDSAAMFKEFLIKNKLLFIHT